MPIELKSMFDEPPVGKLKLAIIGHEKNGKSWLASTARKGVLVHDFDNRAEALQGKQGVFVASYSDPSWPKQPESAQNFLTVLGKLEESLDLSKLGFKVPEGTLVRTNVVDSIQTFGKAFQAYALYNSKDIRRELTIGSMKVFLPGGWDAWNAEMVPVENAILRLLALPTDTIIVLHETAEETADSTSEKPRFTGRVGVFPVRYQRLIKYFNEVWRVKLTQTTVNNKSLYVPRVYPLPNYEFDCSTAMHLDAVEEPNIEAMIAKSEQRQLASGRPSNTVIAGRAYPELQGDSLKKQQPQLK
jgi:hypothetical protein